MPSMKKQRGSPEDGDEFSAIRVQIRGFVSKLEDKVANLSAQVLVEESAINPFLVRAMGIKDFESLAKWAVYQRLGRSFVTSFGTVMQNMVASLIAGETYSKSKGTGKKWWDVYKEDSKGDWYISVKSGPRDMDKDQVEHFALRAKELKAKDSDAKPMIAMCYGKNVWGVITDTLKNNGLNPEEYSYAGKRLYKKLTGDEDGHAELMKVVQDVANEALSDTNLVDTIEKKIQQIKAELKNTYGSFDNLMESMF